ncbi:actin-related protein 5 [Coccinella septempunctata]|uniref:actin-related protein 5 n=1 Tax=Coccinella septempunctata TaxID=41139 RepID=UPI001D088CEA|nr:actin-related protein 5 [Coccinella septempunctata]
MDLLEFQDLKPVPDIVHTYTSSLRNNSTPIIIDNGSYQCRVGWATNSEPLLVFKNLIAKLRKERYKKENSDTSQIPLIQVGNDIVNIEAVRFQLKSQFDKNIVTHFEAQEQLFDYAFSHLGIDTDNIAHPIVLTEAFLNPNSSRQYMTELLFECYNVPGLSYGVDSLFGRFFSDPQQENALIVSLGYHTCHVIPVLKHSAIFDNVRRLNTGGQHVITFLHRILQLKYPAHSTSITLSRVEELLHTICEVALDYRSELNRWLDTDYYENNIKKIQLPYTCNVPSTLTLEQQKERKKELARRLTEINARKREERLAEDEDKLSQLLHIQEKYEIGIDGDELDNALADFQLKNVQDLQKTITNLSMRIEKTKIKMKTTKFSEETEEPPAKQSKSNKIIFENEKDLNEYLQNIKKSRQDILNRKLLRKQKKQDMAKRRTAAGQERMRIISQLARKEKGNDDFGLRDEDWDIYKTISKDGGDTDSDAENEKLLELEEIIREYEPNDLEVVNPGETYQLHVGIERFRAPELLFKPYMLGSSEAGLSEVIAYVLSLFKPEDQLLLASNVIIIGGLSSLKGLRERVLSDLISVRPFRSKVNVKVAKNIGLTSWYGAKKWSKHPEFKKKLLTRQMYEEFGSEYFVTHPYSNPFYKTPKGQTIDVET